MHSVKRFYAACVLSVLLAAPVAAVAAPPPASKTAALYDAALAAARAGDPVRAAALCRATLKLSPNAAPVWATLAGLLAGRMQHADAIAASRKAVALAPKSAPFAADLSDIYLRAGKRADAEATASRALALNPRNDTALSVAATCRLSTRRDKEAIPFLTRLLAVRGGRDRAVSQNLVAAHVRTGDNRGALTAAKAFAAQSPGDAEALLAVVDLATQIGDRETATVYVAKLAQVVPKSPLPAYYRGRIALLDPAKPLGERYALAEKSFQNAVNAAPAEATLRVQLGFAQLAQTDGLKGAARIAKIAAARTNLVAAVLYDNHDPAARRGLALVAEQEGYWSDAATQYDALLRVTPDDTAARRRYAGVLLSAGRKPEAYQQFYELAIRLPGDTVYLKELASFLLFDKDHVKARGVYGQVLERTPGDADALVGIGRCYADDGKPRQARDAYEAAITADPVRETPYLLLAQVQINDGDSDADAVATLERLLLAVPGSQAGRWQLIERYVRAKRDTDARREIGKLTLTKGDPQRNRYRLAAGNLRMVREHWADAVADFETIAADEPDNAEVLFALAGAYTKANRTGDAATVYEKIATVAQVRLTNSATDADARAALVRARAAQNKPDAATAFLKQLDAAAQNGGR